MRLLLCALLTATADEGVVGLKVDGDIGTHFTSAAVLDAVVDDSRLKRSGSETGKQAAERPVAYCRTAIAATSISYLAVADIPGITVA